MSFILNLILQRFQDRVNQAVWLNRKRSLRTGFEPASQTKGPLYGVRAQDAYFGLDWAFQKPPAAQPQGFREKSGVSAPLKTNRGSTCNLKLAQAYEKPYVDSSISRQGKKTYENTDQRAPPKSKGMVSWDGVVRNQKKEAVGVYSREVSKQTPGDKIAAEMKNEPYSFFS